MFLFIRVSFYSITSFTEILYVVGIWKHCIHWLGFFENHAKSSPIAILTIFLNYAFRLHSPACEIWSINCKLHDWWSACTRSLMTLPDRWTTKGIDWFCGNGVYRSRKFGNKSFARLYSCRPGVNITLPALPVVVIHVLYSNLCTRYMRYISIKLAIKITITQKKT